MRLSADAPTLHADRYRLQNGLEVVLDPTGEDTITVSVTYHVGASVQPPGWTGLAHLGEHAMFEGSAHARSQFVDELDALGVTSVNAVTYRDRTQYYEVLPREHLERVLFLEADRMAFLLAQLDQQHLDTQREVILREREERVDLGGLGLVPGLIAGVLYTAPGHPYADLFEHREDLEALRLPDVQWYLSTYYGPENATLVVTGGIDVELTRALVERWFGPIRRVGTPPAPLSRPEVVPVPVERRLVVEAHVRRDQLRVIWATPPYGTPEHAALELLAQYLARRLRTTLVDGSDATALSVNEQDFELVSEMEVVVTTGRRVGTLVALQAVDAELAALEAHPLDSHELARLVRGHVAARIESLESGVERATLMGIRARSAPDEHWSLAWDVERWMAVTPQALSAAAHTWLSPHHRLVLSLAARREAPWDGRVVVDLSLGPDGEELPR